MRFSQLFGKTLRQAPGGVRRTAEQLATRAAMMRHGEGPDAVLPLGYRVLRRIVALASEALAGLGGQEASLPLFDEKSIVRFKADLTSHRDLPRLLYRDANIGRLTAKSLHPSEADFEAGFRKIYHTLLDLFIRFGLAVSAVEAEAGATAFVMPHAEGADELLICESRDCGYAALSGWAGFKIPPGPGGAPGPLTKVATPGCPTIAALAEFLGIETRQTMKAVLYTAREAELVFVVIRGDLEVSEEKLRHALDYGDLRPAAEAEIRAAGAVPGYASPAGLKVAAERGLGGVTVVADPSIQAGVNFAAGANEEGYHLTNVNFPRDFQATLAADVALAGVGRLCPRCGSSALRAERAFVIGGCRAAGATGLTITAETGRPEPVWLGTYWLSPYQMMLCIIDQHHDEAGIVWPEAAAPYDIHLIRLGKAPATVEQADRLYEQLAARGRAVLYDDREESAGVKFADADLIGIPLRVTVSDRSLSQGGIEVRRRDSTEKTIQPVEAFLNGL